MPDPCDRCGHEEDRFSLGVLRLCGRCYQIEMWSLNPGIGLGVVVGKAPGWPADLYDLACSKCGASWVGRELAVCGWCIASIEAKATLRAAPLIPGGVCALVCVVCGFKWDGLIAEACRAPGGLCSGRGSHSLALDQLRKAGRL